MVKREKEIFLMLKGYQPCHLSYPLDIFPDPLWHVDASVNVEYQIDRERRHAFTKVRRIDTDEVLWLDVDGLWLLSFKEAYNKATK